MRDGDSIKARRVKLILKMVKEKMDKFQKLNKLEK